MTLTLKERFMLLNVLPTEGDISTLRIVRDLRMALSPSEEEHSKFEIQVKNGGSQIEWNPTVDTNADVAIGPKATGVIQATLAELSKQKKLTEDYIPLWDKFEPES